MSSAPRGSVGVVGVGTIGLGLVRALRDCGASVNAYDIDEGAREAAVLAGAREAGSAAEVAHRSTVILLSLPDESSSWAALEGPRGIVHGLGSGHVVVQTSTVSAASVRAAATTCLDVDAALLDAPVSGRPPNLAMFVGGEQGALDAVRPVLECVAESIHYMGPTGCGATTKVVSQLSMLLNLASGAEALELGRLQGIDSSRLVAALQAGYGASRALDIVAEFVVPGSFTGNGSPLRAMQKDVSLIDDLRSSESLALWREVRRRFDRAIEAFGPDDDFWSIARIVTEEPRE